MNLKNYVNQYISMEWQNKTISSRLRFKSHVRYVILKTKDFLLHVIEYSVKHIKIFFLFLRNDEY